MLDLLEDKQCSSVGGFDVTKIYMLPTSFLAILLYVFSPICVHLARYGVCSCFQVLNMSRVHLAHFWTNYWLKVDF